MWTVYPRSRRRHTVQPVSGWAAARIVEFHHFGPNRSVKSRSRQSPATHCIAQSEDAGQVLSREAGYPTATMTVQAVPRPR